MLINQWKSEKNRQMTQPAIHFQENLIYFNFRRTDAEINGWQHYSATSTIHYNSALTSNIVLLMTISSPCFYC